MDDCRIKAIVCYNEVAMELPLMDDVVRIKH